MIWHLQKISKNFPKISEDSPKDYLSERHTNVSEQFPKFSKGEDPLPRCFNHKPTNLTKG